MLRRVVGYLGMALGVLVGVPTAAQAQVVQGCQPGAYVDRTAPGAVRVLPWDMDIATLDEHCMQVATGQTVVWNGDLDTHPLAGQGGDMPNPISLHDNGAVTFTAVGTFGYKCLSHSPMIGAIKVVAAAPASSVPALSPWLAAALTALLLASGLLLIRNRLRRAAPDC